MNLSVKTALAELKNMTFNAFSDSRPCHLSFLPGTPIPFGQSDFIDNELYVSSSV